MSPITLSRYLGYLTSSSCGPGDPKPFPSGHLRGPAPDRLPFVDLGADGTGLALPAPASTLTQCCPRSGPLHTLHHRSRSHWIQLPRRPFPAFPANPGFCHFAAVVVTGEVLPLLPLPLSLPRVSVRAYHSVLATATTPSLSVTSCLVLAWPCFHQVRLSLRRTCSIHPIRSISSIHFATHHHQHQLPPLLCCCCCHSYNFLHHQLSPSHDANAPHLGDTLNSIIDSIAMRAVFLLDCIHRI